MLGKRAKTLARLKQAGGQVAKVAKAGLKPSTLYGARCLGMPPRHVQRLRRVVSACLPGKHTGRSTTLRLAMHRCDPLHECRAAPILAWAAAVWDETVPEEELAKAWRHQMVAVGLSPVWSKVKGPAGATVMVLRELGWAWPQWHTFSTRQGFQLRLSEVCPADVKAMVLLDSDAAMWASWTADPEYASLAPRPLIEPIAQFAAARTKGECNAAHRAAVNSVVQGGMWTQARLHESGAAGEAHCQLCGPGVLGTAHHRLYCCPGLRGPRLDSPQEMQHLGELASPDDLLWTRGLVADPSAGWCFRPVLEEIHYAGTQHDGGVISGEGFTDGSLIGKHRVGGKAGWAVAECLPGQNEARVLYFGPLPCTLPVQKRVLRAELWALLQILVVCLPPLRVHIDNATVVKGVQMGRRWCCHSGRPHADVWRRVWHYLDSIGLGPDGITVLKCKSHLSKAAVAALSADQQAVAKGNAEVDKYAKLGAELDTSETGRHETMQEAGARIKKVLRFVGAFSTKARTSEGWPDVTRRQKGRAVVRTIRKSLPPRRPHRIVAQDDGRLRCIVCHRVAGAARRAAFRRAECVGHTAATLPLARNQGMAVANGHPLMATGPWVWCLKCGCHSRRRLMGLSLACPGKPKSFMYRRCLRRLGNEQDPCGGRPLGESARRLTAEEWLAWRSRS